MPRLLPMEAVQDGLQDAETAALVVNAGLMPCLIDVAAIWQRMQEELARLDAKRKAVTQ